MARSVVEVWVVCFFEHENESVQSRDRWGRSNAFRLREPQAFGETPRFEGRRSEGGKMGEAETMRGAGKKGRDDDDDGR